MQITGLIIKSINYGDYDKIITIYASDNQLYSVLCKGVRRIKSKRLTAIMLLNLVECEIKKASNSIFTLQDIKVLDHHNYIKEDYEVYLHFNYFCEVIAKYVLNAKESIAMYEYLLEMVKKVQTGFDIQGLRYLFDFRIYFELGITPYLDACCICQSKYVSAFSVSDGGFVCDGCKTHTAMNITPKQVIVLKNLSIADLFLVNSITINPDNILFFNNLFKQYSRYHIHFKINSVDFI